MTVSQFKKIFLLHLGSQLQGSDIAVLLNYIDQRSTALSATETQQLLTIIDYASQSITTTVTRYLKEVLQKVCVLGEPIDFQTMYEGSNPTFNVTPAEGQQWNGYWLVLKLDEDGRYLSSKTIPALDQNDAAGGAIQSIPVSNIGSFGLSSKLYKGIVQLENGSSEASGDAIRPVHEFYFVLQQNNIDTNA